MKTYRFIDSVLNDKIEAIKNKKNVYELGRVLQVHDYIVEVSGLENAFFFERVYIGDKAEGYINYIGRNSVTVVLVKRSAPVYVGDEVMSTGTMFCAYYSEDSIGHIIDIFAEDKLRNEFFSNRQKIDIFTPPIPIMDRTSVNRPLYTGIVGIDLLYPIGRGQRQLIIGDKKTGKTQIAMDAIVNQRDQDVLCIYIAIGKTKKEVKEIYSELLKQGAMEYTVILAAFQDESAPVLYNTPQAGLAFAEKYILQGHDVLVVIDDLTLHADNYRELSLLSGKVPGRDAYPPDIFFAHASLLEKGCQHKNGGSITILPIVETKSGEITDYISTNIISITDGQIVLSAKNFENGQKPAIDYGLSVSRLGGAVQIPDLRKLGAAVRRELLSYLETKVVFELANIDEMSQELREKMQRGQEISKRMNQYKFSARTPEEIKNLFRELVVL
ncbi:MAG: F0F1 ATP synthase subunit alpha [Peptococcia bacterium]|jgi:F-type H+-transporting ATPase subunit alpha